jgi:hypothetical protein
MKRRTFRQKPTKVSFRTNNGRLKTFMATRCEYPFIELKGEPIESFERVEEIKEIILLGKDGGIRRIILKWN